MRELNFLKDQISAIGSNDPTASNYGIAPPDNVSGSTTHKTFKRFK